MTEGKSDLPNGAAADPVAEAVNAAKAAEAKAVEAEKEKEEEEYDPWKTLPGFSDSGPPWKGEFLFEHPCTISL